MAAAVAGVDTPRGGGVIAPPRVRVLHVITSLTVGGAERLVVSAACRLQPDRFEHAICCLTGPGALAAEAAAAGVPVFTIGSFPGLRHPLAFAKLVGVLRRWTPAIVHTHLQSANLYGRVAARLAGVPVVIATEHNLYVRKPRRYLMVERLLARHTDAMIAVSATVQQFLSTQLGLPSSTIRVVRNGVAIPDAFPARVAALRARLGSRGPIVATVASLTVKKGHEFLLHALAQARDRGIPCTAVLAGDGPERRRLEALAASLGLRESTIFLGAVPAADVLEVADLFVLPSIVEGLPLALLEAMFAGKAVIATAVGGVPEVIDSNENGVLVPAADENALADAIERLLGSDDLRTRLGARAQATIRSGGYTEAAYLASLGAVYRETLEGRNA